MPKYRIKTRRRMTQAIGGSLAFRGQGRVIQPSRSMVVEQDKRPMPAKGMKVKRVA